MRRRNVRVRGPWATPWCCRGLLVALVVLAGCASAAETATIGSTVAFPRPVAPVEIASLELVDMADSEELRLSASAPLVWTQYRNEAGHLVVELPNTVVGGGVALTDSGELVQSVSVETDGAAGRPLTRLVVATSRAAEHTLVVEGGELTLRFDPIGAASPTLEVAVAEPAAAFPLPERIAAQQEQVEVSRETAVAGTPELPASGPPVRGVPASVLQTVQVHQADGGTVVHIVGDGEFEFSTFVLENPPRFVIDLEGVVKTDPRATVTVGSADLERIRMAQFRNEPDAVARVVLDLNQPERPDVERVGDSLVLRFGSAAGQTAVGARAEPAVAQAEPAPLPPAGLAAAVETPSRLDGPGPDAEMAQRAGETEPGATALVATPEPLEPTAAAPSATVAAALEQEPTAVTPLEIRVEGGAERVRQPPVRPTSDVGLFEAQEVRAQTPPPPSVLSAAPSAFGVQSLGGQPEFVGEPVSLSLKDSDITEVLRSFAREFDLNIVIQPGVGGPVTVELDSVPWEQALDAILKTQNLGMELEGNILRIAPVGQLQREAQERQRLAQARALSVPLATIMKRVSYSRASDLARILTSGLRSGGGFGLSQMGLTQTGILSQRGSVSVDDRTNTLIIRELPDFLDTVIQIIENLDVPEKQVMIEARVVETTRNFSRSLGIDWSFTGVADAAHGNTTGIQFPNNIDAGGGVGLLTGGANGFLDIGLGNILNTFQLDLALQAAEGEGLVNVISAPKVATLNNERASIQTGLQIPIQTVANNTVSVQFVNATLRLNVTPHVTAEGTILMDIEIQKREPQLGLIVAGATNAPIATREAATRVIVRDGGTAVIGGIYTVSSNYNEDRVPGLANIPILGHLFKNRNRSNTNEELLIFITPRVIQL
ncbi:MAG TPA: type IV pilus secretin PilQ [Thermoanaerobaculia bacterium]|nr:type IV pilus secretin PilQ [Thermoanaerobaculia bacterium]